MHQLCCIVLVGAPALLPGFRLESHVVEEHIAAIFGKNSLLGLLSGAQCRETMLKKGWQLPGYVLDKPLVPACAPNILECIPSLVGRSPQGVGHPKSAC